ncbi:MAG: hypothetical protein HZA93_00625 [Verrucomicrobia bacterium]|nr:hypothetical protein [Verrucomicrobiota bacterium]
MEAETYLSSGYGVRISIESKVGGWVPLKKLANVWQPLRLKGIQVARDVGRPFLAATQVFDLRPIPRKWLALERTHNAQTRFVKRGQILVTCSGAVGRATLAFVPHEDALISHDLLRIKALETEMHGWIYAYLRAPKVRAMMTGAKYGHIIKHLETSHLDALPIPEVPDRWRKHFADRVAEILDLRDAAHADTIKAEALFENALGEYKPGDNGETGFEIHAKQALTSCRRRFDSQFHNPLAAGLVRHWRKCGVGMTKIRDAGFDAWLPARFRRIPASDGVEFVDSGDLFELNPDIEKRIADGDFGDRNRGRVEPGWLLVARSGQIYGINGSLVIAGAWHRGKVISDHVIRLAPRSDATMRVGYLLTALSHPTHGRPIIKALPYGSSIPEIEVADLESLEVVRLSTADENAIAELAERSAESRARADIIETEIATEAEALIAQFVAGENLTHVAPVSVSPRDRKK